MELKGSFGSIVLPGDHTSAPVKNANTMRAENVTVMIINSGGPNAVMKTGAPDPSRPD